MAVANPYIEPNFYRQFRRYYTYIEPVVSDPIVRSYFSIVASLILTALFLIFALSPTLTTILGLVKKIDDQKKTISQMDQKINDLITAQDSYSSFQPRLGDLLYALPENSTPESTIDSVYTAASASAVAVNALQFGDIPISSVSGTAASSKNKDGASSDVRMLDFSLVVSGTAENIENFLTKLEEMPRIIKITNLSFGSKKGVVTISAKSYFLPMSLP